MDFSPQARVVLFILNHLSQKNLPGALDAIRTHPIWAQSGLDLQALTRTLDPLLKGGLVSCERGIYSLTKPGLARVKGFMSQGYSALLVAAAQSPTCRKFCEQVYGLDLCQFNSLSMPQLEKLLEIMDLDASDHVLDLGCGVGLISEYISDVTGARVMGIDFAAQAIQLAQERARPKGSRLSYQVMDMDELDFPGGSFSGVISIDALQFVHDIKRTVQQAQTFLVENGQMGIFYSVNLSAGEADELLEPDQTPLARVCQECGLDYQTWDFTQDEIGILEKILQVAGELRGDYEAEGILDLYEMTISDAGPMLGAAQAGRRRRYLFHIRQGR